MSILFTVILSAIIGALIGAVFPTGYQIKTDPDLKAENAKLRKENEVLWARLKKEGKIEKF